jgi:hypothetical protein
VQIGRPGIGITHCILVHEEKIFGHGDLAP